MTVRTPVTHSPVFHACRNTCHLGVSILPVIAGAIAVNNTKKAQTATDIGIRLAIMLSMPCAVIMYLMSNEILTVLFHNSSSSAMLTAISTVRYYDVCDADNVRDITVGRENNAAVFNGHFAEVR